MSEITLADKLSCARRDLRLRRYGYPGFVERGIMTQAQADFQLACMEAIVRDYEQLTAEASVQGTLCKEEG